MKLVIAEPGSRALRAYLEAGGPTYTSRIAGIELRRAVRRQGDRAADELAESVLAAVRMIELDHNMSRAAGELQPSTLRTLDAVHLAAALVLGEDCDAFVSYDSRLNLAARAAGLEVRSPA